MGGDHGPSVILPGLAIALKRHPSIRYILFGLEDECLPILDAHPDVKAVSEFHNCEMAVQMDDKPSQALRKGRKRSTMWQAIESVKLGHAQVCISAGNTGALMAMSKFCLRTMANIERPAIAAIWPTLRGESVVLDVGANLDADVQQLLDFSLMGAAMARALFGIEKPTIGFLNIGVEEIKGQEEIKEAGLLLRESDFSGLKYFGFVEGDDLGRGTVDVVVTDGFSGNIALKTAEGTARQIAEYLRAAMSTTIMAKIGYLFARQAFARLRQKMDPSRVNGGVFLGFNGVVVKSHGGANDKGFAAAVEMGFDMARNGLKEKIEQDIEQYYSRGPGAASIEVVVDDKEA